MKYMLMMHAPKQGWTNAGIGTWPPERIKAHIDYMVDLNKQLRASGELVDAQGLAGPEEAKSVRSRKDGAPDTDGPFAEAKEIVGGYWVWRVKSIDEAVEWIKKAPFPPSFPVDIEIRPISEEVDFGDAITPAVKAQLGKVRDLIEQNQRS